MVCCLVKGIVQQAYPFNFLSLTFVYRSLYHNFLTKSLYLFCSHSQAVWVYAVFLPVTISCALLGTITEKRHTVVSDQKFSCRKTTFPTALRSYRGKMIPLVLLPDNSLFLKPTMSSITEGQNIDQEMCVLITSYPFRDKKKSNFTFFPCHVLAQQSSNKNINHLGIRNVTKLTDNIRGKKLKGGSSIDKRVATAAHTDKDLWLQKLAVNFRIHLSVCTMLHIHSYS